MNYLHHALQIRKTRKKGRGVFALEALPAGIVVEIAPVIVMTAAERKKLDKTLLHDYIFEWGADRKSCCMALGYIPLYNHSYKPNCEYLMNFKSELIAIQTLRDIKKGEELQFNYNGAGDLDAPLWFHKK
ncbi:MAG: lysine methyltransferase [Flaviaesturariibacter sp.]|nr:lysine methyltransferase [Flaviaesturariibacter sp.]